jgi:hypothetical protein
LSWSSNLGPLYIMTCLVSVIMILWAR